MRVLCELNVFCFFSFRCQIWSFCLFIRCDGWSASSVFFFEYNRTVVGLILLIDLNQFICSTIKKKEIVSNLMKKMSIMSQLVIKDVHVHN
jgi:hypothetical protein